MCIATVVLVSACSPGADYPTVLADPVPRADQPMTPDQVRQATDALISDRTQLSAQAQQANSQPGPAAPPNGVANAAAPPGK
jgi:hypothetical protein